MKNNTLEESNKLKQMYTLNLIANLNANYATETEAELYKNILNINVCLEDPTVSGIVGKWKTVWGPAVGNTNYTRTYKKETIKHWATDNALYIAQKEDTKEYFIGISGTNGVSLKGWFEQDFDVATSVPWEGIAIEGNPRISQAGSTGLNALLALKPAKGAKGQGTTFMDFLLKEVQNVDCSISVGGHSLGGCLTPLVATALADKMQGAVNSNQYKGVKINAYPTAGPTPGNQDFANHLQRQLNEYHAVYNTNDLVPLCWNFEGLQQLTKNYGSWKFGTHNIQPQHPIIARFLYWASHYAKEQAYVRMPEKPNENFKVKVWENTLIPIKKIICTDDKIEQKINIIAGVLFFSSVKKSLSRIYNKDEWQTLKTFLRFLLQVLLQHVSAYNNPKTSNEKLPWQFTDKERSAIHELFNFRKKSREKKKESREERKKKRKERKTKEKWTVATGIVLLTKLADLAADWLDKNPINVAELEGVDLDITTEIDTDLTVPETEEEAIAALEKLLEESPELVEALLFIGDSNI
ncbi:MAG: lipase family protein [Aureispira sp.]